MRALCHVTADAVAALFCLHVRLSVLVRFAVALFRLLFHTLFCTPLLDAK